MQSCPDLGMVSSSAQRFASANDTSMDCIAAIYNSIYNWQPARANMVPAVGAAHEALTTVVATTSVTGPTTGTSKLRPQKPITQGYSVWPDSRAPVIFSTTTCIKLP